MFVSFRIPNFQDSGSELLNAFRYADFSFDENKDVPTLNVPVVPMEINENDLATSKSWDEIIPEADRKKFADEERERAEKELFLGPRQRTKACCDYFLFWILVFYHIFIH